MKSKKLGNGKTLSPKKMGYKQKHMLHGTKPTWFVMIPEAPALKAKTKKPKEIYNTFGRAWPDIEKYNRQGYGAYMAANECGQSGRTTKGVTKVNALFIDVDKGKWGDEDVEQILHKFGAEPHLIVATSKGNYHVYWLMDAVDLRQFRKLQKQLADRFGSDPKVCDLPRVMRLAGTLHHKSGKPVMAGLVHCAKDLPAYKVDSFVESMLGDQAGRQSIPADRSPDVSAPLHRCPPGDLSEDLEALKPFLFRIPADDRKTWIEVGMGLHSTFGEAAYGAFVEWSRTSPKFDADEALRQWKSFKPNGGITVGTIYRLAEDAQKHHPPAPGTKLPGTVIEMAEEFVRRHRDICRYDVNEKRWCCYAGGMWKKGHQYAENIAKNFLKKLLGDAKAFGYSAKIGLVQRMQTYAGISEVLKVAQTDLKVHIDASKFDADPCTVGVRYSGEIYAVDLKTGKPRPAKPEDMISRLLGPEYDPGQKCPLWMNFIREVTDGDDDLATALQMIAGYCLFGHTNEQLMFVVIGHGGNGKGVVTRTLTAILGEYARAINNSLLRPHYANPNAATPALADIVGARLITCSEFKKNATFDEPFIKQLTGSDQISYRGNYSDQMIFTPQGKLFMISNEFPRIAFGDPAMWRRIYPIHFTRKFTGKNRDRHLEEKLKPELAGILNWAIEGAVMYSSAGNLYWAPAVTQFKKALKQESDCVGTWMKECCVDDDEARTQSSTAFESYADYAKREKRQPVSIKEFKRTLEDKGYVAKRTGKGNFFAGFRIKPLS